jgi:hypothetical protein
LNDLIHRSRRVWHFYSWDRDVLVGGASVSITRSKAAFVKLTIRGCNPG